MPAGITASQVQAMQSHVNSRLGTLVNTVRTSIVGPLAAHAHQRLMSRVALQEWYSEAFRPSIKSLEQQVRPKLRKQLERQKKRLGYNRQARKAVRLYYGMPNANAHVANALIDWMQDDRCGSIQKRKDWYAKTWGEWDTASAMRQIKRYVGDVTPLDTPFERSLDFGGAGGSVTGRRIYRSGNPTAIPKRGV